MFQENYKDKYIGIIRYMAEENILAMQVKVGGKDKDTPLLRIRTPGRAGFIDFMDTDAVLKLPW